MATKARARKALTSSLVVEQHFLGRQPILDRKLNLYGFDLLYRSRKENTATGDEAVTATANVVNTILHTPELLGSYKGYIHVDRTLLMSPMLELLPSEKIGIEVLPTLELDETTVARCRQLKDLGFEFVLDDYNAADARFDPLLGLADQVKINVGVVGIGALPKLGTLQRRTIKIVVKNVESHDDVVRCKALGVDLYQGYFFAKPKVVSGKRLAHSELALLKLIGVIEADSETTVIENALKEEPSLTIDLLRLTNSAAFAPQRITSIAHAIMMLGRQQLKRWLQLLMFGRLSPGATFPSPLLQMAATRARFMEIAIDSLVPGDKALAGRAFLTGLISLMSALLGQPLHVILTQLDPEQDIWDAVVDHQGRLGALLEITEHWDKGDYEHCVELCQKLPGLTLDKVNEAQMMAFTWSNNLGNAVP